MVSTHAATAAGIAQSDKGLCDTWREQADAAIELLALTRAEFICDDVWTVGGLDIPPGRTAKSLGARMLAAARAGLIERTGSFRTTECASRHCSPVPVWRSLIYADAP